jgi:predicted nucleic acid-binding protein
VGIADHGVLVDTSVRVEDFNGTASRQSDRLDALLGSGTVLTGDLILAQLLQGYTRDAEYHRARSPTDEWPCADLVGRAVALQAARNSRALRAHGSTVRKTVDVLIGTYCIMHDHVLLHADRDFMPLQRYLGLQVLDG